MPFTLSEIIVLFFTYSFVGWLWETVYCSLKDRHFDYRGFLFGPYCPVYGFAVTTILVFTDRFQDNLLLLFLVGLVVATIFEYLASLFLEKTFHVKLWDYSHLWGNLQGRVAPVISLFWGVGVMLLVKFVQPTVQRVINWEEGQTHRMLAGIIFLVMGTDTVLSMISILHLHTTTQMWDQRIHAFLKQKRLTALADVQQHLAEIRPHRRLSWNQRRLLHSFKDLRMVDAPHFNHLKHDIFQKRL